MNRILPGDRLDPAADATRSQRIASDPGVSAFVSASAGSGKTKLLVDRLLRLMLPRPGRAAAAPERILCLTFTKAGAANMAIRLRQTLADWVVLDDASLDRALAGLDLPHGPGAAGAASRAQARSLFARVLDLPGGLRIETIHAFCESLLRRFPLEAAISPHFRLVEDFDADGALERAREGAIEAVEAGSMVRRLAARLDTDAHAALTRMLRAQSGRLAHLERHDPEALVAALHAALPAERRDEAALARERADGMDREALADAFRALVADGAPKEAETGRAGLEWLAAPDADPEAWSKLFLAASFEPRRFPAASSRLGRRRPEIGEAFGAEAARLLALAHAGRAAELVDATAALLGLARPALAAWRDEKDALGLLDFDDLIARTERLLTDPGAIWVLFKLDGGLDHLLLDEVQDTSATQWAIAGRLTEEFFAEAGPDAPPRTVFAVGDFKQSIFSFQGASPASFAEWRDIFGARVRTAGREWVTPGLNVSFRSAPAILDFVDAVFAEPPARRGVAEPGAAAVPPHSSAAAWLPGRVELWPLAPAEDGGAGADAAAAAPPSSPWEAARANRGLATAEQRLAAEVARHLARLVAEGAFRPGEIMILTRRRGGFARAMVRALKALDVPVAGLDRIVLTEQLAVQDLLALCDALLLPDDELAFASFLKSPLGGLDDDALMRLALHRGDRTLREVLADRSGEDEAFGRAHALFDRLFGRVDFASPHALLAEALGEWGGRARMLARLGPEASDAIDELLGLALRHETTAIPSMQGFVHWVRRQGDEIKREAGEPEAGGAGEIRLLTVHASKGLEARLVVLSDTMSVPGLALEKLFWTGTAPRAPIWYPGRDLDMPAIAAIRAAREAELIEEYNRLLYVGLTRAKERLIVCGWAGGRPARPESWYARCEAAFERLSGPGAGMVAREEGVLPWDGAVRSIASVPVPVAPPGPRPAAPPAAPPVAAPAAPMPGWAGTAPEWRGSPPPPEPLPRRRLAPSRPEGVEWGPPPAATSPLTGSGRAEARRRGEVLHALLQHLPEVEPALRRDAAIAYASARLEGDRADAAGRLAEEALAVLDHPALEALFGPAGRAEQRLAGIVGGIAVSGVVDRMAIGEDAVRVADFKSGRDVPDDVSRTPVAYLRQMAAYRAVLRAMFPHRPVSCALVWTASAAVVPLPDALLDAHAPGEDAPPPLA